MASITFYGGVDEIGGNKILLEIDRSSIFLDFGKSFRSEGAFYDPPYFKSWNTFDLMKIGALPPIDIYDWPTPKECKIPIINKKIDGFFITHPHADHYEYISELADDNTVFAGEASELLMKMRMQQSGSNWETKFNCNWENFHNGVKVEVGDAQITPYTVDHSVPAAYGFIVHISGKTIVYTGDFRAHGLRADLTEEFLRVLEKESVDALICEGTRFAGDDDTFLRFFEEEYNKQFGKAPQRKKIPAKTEAEVEANMGELIGESEGLVVIETGVADLDRIRTILNATKKAGRQLILQDKQAYLCLAMDCACDDLKSYYDSSSEKKQFVSGLPTPKDLKVFFKRSKIKNQYKEQRGYKKWQTDHFEKFWDVEFVWGETATEKSTGREEIRRNASEYVLCTHYAGPVFQELYDGQFKDISYILSKSEPFNEEMVISFTAWNNWMRLLGIDEYYQLHVSGHCTPAEIKDAVTRINPSLIYPIHTEHQEAFREFAKSVARTEKNKRYEI